MPAISRSVARRLAKLPKEITYQVLDDLDIQGVLRLACSSPNFDDIILTHLGYSCIFSTRDLLYLARDYYQLYLEMLDQARRNIPSKDFWDQYSRRYIRHYMKKRPFSKDPILYRGCQTSAWKSEAERIPDAMDVPRLLYPFLNELLNGAYYNVDGALSLRPKKRDEKKFYPAALSEIRAIFETIKERDERIRANKIAIVDKLIRLFKEYPNMLKNYGDLVQKPRKNQQHILRQLEGRREALKKNRLMASTQPVRGNSLFSTVGLPLVPYKTLLKNFCTFLENHPLEISSTALLPSIQEKSRHGEPVLFGKNDVGQVSQGLEQALGRLELRGNRSNEESGASSDSSKLSQKLKKAAAQDFNYPSSIIKAILIAKEGLTYFYTLSSNDPHEHWMISMRRFDHCVSSMRDEANQDSGGTTCVPRTHFTPYSAPNLQNPRTGLGSIEQIWGSVARGKKSWTSREDIDMESMPEPGFQIMGIQKRRDVWRNDAKELEWLEAFLVASKWMQEHWHDEETSIGDK